MKIKGKDYQTIWMEGKIVKMIDQNALPYALKIHQCNNYKETATAIKNMTIRGAGAIGAAAAYAMAQLAMGVNTANYIQELEAGKKLIESSRPTAQNLFYATTKVFNAAKNSVEEAVETAKNIALEDIERNKRIGQLGNELLSKKVKVLTHCNAGWLAFVDYGTALSPVYTAFEEGKDVFVWVDETRPRNQGARLTAWELQQADIPYNIIADNAAAYLMAKNQVDIVIVGADRIAINGDVANKIGTLEKAIAAKYFDIPFYVAAPTSTIDHNSPSGKAIPIEIRDEKEQLFVSGINEKGKEERILIASPESKAFNPAFDITPAELISGIITEKGIVKADLSHIQKLF
jgi:S-methyl-5-thioribose-1-phosphate isomerase